MFDEYGILADTASGDDNTALIDGTGSVWSNTQYVYVGLYGGTNQMRVTNGGAVLDETGVIGYSNASPDNVVIVSGPGFDLVQYAGVIPRLHDRQQSIDHLQRRHRVQQQ